MAREMGEQLVQLAERVTDPTYRLVAHDTLGDALFHLGEYATAAMHLEPAIALIDPTMQPVLALRHGLAPGVRCLTIEGLTLWCLGWPTQAVQRSQEALTLALALDHPYSLAATHLWVSLLHQRRRDIAALAVQSEALVTLATTQGWPLMRGYGTWLHGWARAMQGQVEEGLVELRQGLAALRATGQGLSQPPCMVSLAQVLGHTGQVTEGLRLLSRP